MDINRCRVWRREAPCASVIVLCTEQLLLGAGADPIPPRPVIPSPSRQASSASKTACTGCSLPQVSRRRACMGWPRPPGGTSLPNTPPVDPANDHHKLQRGQAESARFRRFADTNTQPKLRSRPVARVRKVPAGSVTNWPCAVASRFSDSPRAQPAVGVAESKQQGASTEPTSEFAYCA